MSTLTVLRARLAAIEAKILEILQTGQEYSITGSHSVRNPALEALERQETTIRRKILLAKGYSTRIMPNFSGNAAGADYL